MNAIMSLVPAASWDLGNFLQNATSTLKEWGGYFIILIGVVMVVYSVFVIAKGLITHGRSGSTNWVIAVILLILGGAFMVGGFSFVENIASGGKQTIEDLGNGAILFMSMLP